MKHLIKNPFMGALLFLLFASQGIYSQMTAPYAPKGNSLFIFQKGTIEPSTAIESEVYFTLFNGDKRVNKIKFTYNGNGYLQLLDRTVLGYQDEIPGADGIIHHWDGDLLIAAQGNQIYKMDLDPSTTSAVHRTKSGSDNYHLFMDPDGKTLWSAGIPGNLYRLSLDESEPDNLGEAVQVEIVGSEAAYDNVSGTRNTLTNLAWLEDCSMVYTRSHWNGYGYFGYAEWVDEDGNAIKPTDKCSITRDEKKIINTVRKSSNTATAGYHGMHYDPYSKTVITFGEHKILQLDPVTKHVVAELDFEEMGFIDANTSKYNNIRFDQGTTTGAGHIFVADNMGYLIFVDYTSNAQKRIDDNIMIHMEWLDYDLDDVAPMSGHGSGEEDTQISSGSGWSSSSTIYSSNIIIDNSSSSDVTSSSSLGTSSSSDVTSSSSLGTSSSSDVTSSSSLGSSSSDSTGTGGDLSSSGESSSSDSTGTGGDLSSSGESSSSDSTGTGGDLSSSGESSSSDSTGTGGDLSSSGESSSSDSTGTGGDLSSSGESSSSDSTGTGGDLSSSGESSSSDSTGTGTGGDLSSSSADSTGTGTGGDLGSSSSSGGSGTDEGGDLPPIWGDSGYVYVPYDSTSTGPEEGRDPTNYYNPELEKVADSTVESGYLLVPVDPNSNIDSADVIEYNGNLFEKVSTDNKELIPSMKPGETTRDSVPVGYVVEVELNMEQLKTQLALNNGDEIVISGSSKMIFIDPNSGQSVPLDSITINAGDENVKIWMIGTEVGDGEKMTFSNSSGSLTLPYGDFVFYDIVPQLEIAIIKSTDADSSKDAIEVFLADSLPENVTIDKVVSVYKGDTILVDGDVNIEGEFRDRFSATIDENSPLRNVEDLSDDDIIIVYFVDEFGIKYQREVPLRDLFAPVLSGATVLKGYGEDSIDSMFVDFHIRLDAADLVAMNNIVTLNGMELNPDLALLISKSMIMFTGTEFQLDEDAAQNFLQLYPGLSLTHLQYIVEEEFAKKVLVTVVDRLPPMGDENGYYDTDGDGVMDSIVFNFEGPVTEEQLDWMELIVPWYTSANKVVYMSPNSSQLVLSEDGMSVGWKVVADVPLKSHLTEIPSMLPGTKLNIHYPIGIEIVEETREVLMNDKMPPALYNAKLTYATGDDKYDTLRVRFTENVTEGTGEFNFLKYFHGENGDTLTLPIQNISFENGEDYATILIPHGTDNGLFPGDSLFIAGISAENEGLNDAFGNTVSINSSSIVVEGTITHLVETVKMGGFDPDDAFDENLGSVSLVSKPMWVRGSDLMEEGELGHLIELGGRFLPQLLSQLARDRNISGEEAIQELKESIVPEDIEIDLQVYYFDNNGQYVTHYTNTIGCANKTVFGDGGNCLTTDKKMFARWNYKSIDNRLVAAGVYVVNFKLVVRMKGTRIEEETQERWGVVRQTGGFLHKH